MKRSRISWEYSSNEEDIDLEPVEKTRDQKTDEEKPVDETHLLEQQYTITDPDGHKTITPIFSDEQKTKKEYTAPGVIYLYLRFHRLCETHYIPFDERNFEGLQILFMLPNKWYDPKVISREELAKLLNNKGPFDAEKRMKTYNESILALPTAEHQFHKQLGFCTEEVESKDCPTCCRRFDQEYIPFLGRVGLLDDDQTMKEFNDYCISRDDQFERHRYYDPTTLNMEDLCNNYGVLGNDKRVVNKSKMECILDQRIKQFEEYRAEGGTDDYFAWEKKYWNESDNN